MKTKRKKIAELIYIVLHAKEVHEPKLPVLWDEYERLANQANWELPEDERYLGLINRATIKRHIKNTWQLAVDEGKGLVIPWYSLDAPRIKILGYKIAQKNNKEDERMILHMMAIRKTLALGNVENRMQIKEHSTDRKLITNKELKRLG